MTWFKVDDRLHGHVKTRRAGIEAMGLWVVVGSYCADNLTDGKIAADVPELFAGKAGAKLAASLVKAGLWHEAEGGGWIFHDWESYQPTSAKVLADREARSEAGKKGGLKSGESRGKQRGTKNEANASAVASAHAKQNGSNGETKTNPVPVPVPVPGEPEGDTRAILPPRSFEPKPRIEEFAVANAFQRGGGNVIEFRCAATLKNEFLDALTETDVTLEECERLAAFLAAGGAAWAKRKRFDIGWLMGQKGARLAELLTKADEWDGEPIRRDGDDREEILGPDMAPSFLRAAAEGFGR